VEVVPSTHSIWGGGDGSISLTDTFYVQDKGYMAYDVV